MSDPEFNTDGPSKERLQGKLSPATPEEQRRIDRESTRDPQNLAASIAIRIIPGMHDAVEDLRRRGYRFDETPGHELNEMRKYFGAGTGTYLCQADFGHAKVVGQKVTDSAQARMALALSFDDRGLARMEKALQWFRRYDQLVKDLRVLRYRLTWPLRAARATRAYVWDFLRTPSEFDYFFGIRGEGPGWRVRRARAWINVKVLRRDPVTYRWP